MELEERPDVGAALSLFVAIKTVKQKNIAIILVDRHQSPTPTRQITGCGSLQLQQISGKQSTQLSHSASCEDQARERDGGENSSCSPSFGELSWRLDADLEMVAGRGSINA